MAKQAYNIQQNKRLLFLIVIVVILLLIPLIAMQFTNEVNWNIMDFLVAGGLLFSTALLCDFILRKFANSSYKLLIIIAILFLLLLVWVELAVGLFGTPFSGN